MPSSTRRRRTSTRRRSTAPFSIGAENSVGFHNPPEAMRILGDAIAFAVKSEAFLRQILTRAGVEVPMKVELELHKYLDERGEKKLKGNPALEFKDPMSIQEMF